jgi:hypothetical protein
VAPGRYTVRVELGGQAAEAGFEIAADPRSRYTPEQVAAQYELDLRLWGLLSDLYDGVNRARRARSELGESESDRRLRQELEAVESELVSDGGGKRSIFVGRVALDLRLVGLRQVVGEAPPNASAVELADQVQAQLQQVLARLSELLERAQQAGARRDDSASLVSQGTPGHARPVQQDQGDQAKNDDKKSF